MKCLGISVVFILVLAAVCRYTPAAEQKSGVVVITKYEKSVRGGIDGFPLLVLRGTHRERGKAHGFLGAKEIVKTVDAMAVAINQAGQSGKKGVSWAQAGKLVGRFQFPERFILELEGMLDGVEEALPKADDRTLTATGKPVTTTDLKLLQCGDVLELMLCSQFSAWGDLSADGSTIVGRNWDYPPIFPFDTYCILAVEPSEKGLSKTLDCLWFGMIGAGFACLNEDGVYISADDGGKEERDKVKSPCPAALAVRMAAEGATADDPLRSVEENIDQKTALNILYHVVAPPRKPGDAPRAWIFEHAPGAEKPFAERIRRPTAKLPDAIFITNTPMVGRKDSDSGCERYERILKALSSGAKLDFESARLLLDAVARSGLDCTTQYSGVIYPERMEMRVAVSPAPGRPATEERYTPVRWADVWALAK